MIRADQIKSSFYKEVGFNEPTLSLTLTDNTDLVIDTDNLTSYSGLWFDDTNFCSIQNIFDCQENKDITNAQFNDLLKRMSEASIVNFCEKVVANESDFIRKANLYPYEKSFKNTITTNDNFVGFQIQPNCECNKILSIPWIELSLNEAKEITVYLFNSNMPGTAIYSQSITTVADQATVMNLVDDNNKPWYVSDSDSFKGGTFYLGYFEDDLGTAKAYKKDLDSANTKLITRDYYIEPVSVNHVSNVLDVTEVDDSSEIFGLNAGINIYNDYTQLIIDNKQLFNQGYQMQMSEKVLNMILTSGRGNDIQSKLSEEVLINQINLLLYGSSNAGIEGIQGALKRQVDDLKKMFFYKHRIVKGTLR